MKFVVLASLVAAFAFVSVDANCCSKADAEVVVAQWTSVHSADSAGEMQLTIGKAIFGSLFAKAPGAMALFSGVGGGDLESPIFQAQINRVISGIDLCTNSLTDKGLRESVFAHLQAQHAVRPGVTAAAFVLMKDSIMEVMTQLVADFNVDAWDSCLGVIVGGISKGLP